MASQSVETVQYNALVALVSHLVSLECGVPVQHFTDGFRTNHEARRPVFFSFRMFSDVSSKQKMMMSRTNIVRSC